MTTPPANPGGTIEPWPGSLLARGVALLFVSLIFTIVITNNNPGDGTRSVLAWFQQVAFWLGIVCIAGHVLAEVLCAKKPKLD